MKKAAFYLFSGAIWIACFALVALVFLEYLGGYAMIGELDGPDEEDTILQNSEYYGRVWEQDPYQATKTQHLHPFYLFGMPWRAEQIAAASNEVVSLDAQGFRRSFSNGAPRAGAFIGASIAFGYGASNDAGTVPSALNRLQDDYDFRNYGIPAWNSHQEMIAYARAPADAAYVVVLSGGNDMLTAARYCRKGFDFPVGSPESFDHLAAITDDIRGKRKGSGGLLARLFPQTAEQLGKLWRNEVAGTDTTPDCRAQVEEAADVFVENQRVIRDLAAARGAPYLLVLHPHLHFLRPAERQRHAWEQELRVLFYDRVLDSAFCREARCLDASNIFAGAEPPLHVLETPDEPGRAIFVDRVHLTDRGNAILAGAIAGAMAN